MHICMYACTYARMNMSSRIHKRIHTHTHTQSHTYTHLPMQVRSPRQLNTYTHTTHTHSHTPAHVGSIPTPAEYIHTYYTHTQSHTCPCRFDPQQNTLRALSTAHVCKSPADTCCQSLLTSPSQRPIAQSALFTHLCPAC